MLFINIQIFQSYVNGKTLSRFVSARKPYKENYPRNIWLKEFNMYNITVLICFIRCYYFCICLIILQRWPYEYFGMEAPFNQLRTI